MMESTVSLQGSLQKAGPSLQEATLEGTTLLKDKSRQKTFMPFLPILVKTFIEGSLSTLQVRGDADRYRRFENLFINILEFLC